MSTHDRPRLSVVIPTYNDRHLLAPCLASLEKYQPEYGLEVIVADDASTDGTAEWLLEEHPHVQIVRLHVNGGFVAAANAGIAAARGEFIQLLNNDAEVTSGWFAAGLAPFRDPSVGSVAPLVLVRSDPARVDSAGDRYSIVGWPSKRGHGEPAIDWHTHQADQVFGASGSSAIYRANVLKTAGGFDPAFGSYYEDVDLAFRLRWMGFTCAFAPKCVVLHDISATYNHAKPALQRRMSRNAEFLFWANLPWGWLVLAVIPHLAFIAIQLALKSARGRGLPFLLGKLDALRSLSWFRARRAHLKSLTRAPIHRPRFPIDRLTTKDIRNHRRRPLETSRSVRRP